MLKKGRIFTHRKSTSGTWHDYSTGIDGDIIQGMNTLQPKWTPDRQCAAVVVDNLLHPGWITVQCGTPHASASFVCERSISVDTELNKNITDSTSPSRIAAMSQVICPYRWITEAHSCFRLFRKTLHADTPTDICNLIGANVYLSPEAFESLTTPEILLREQTLGVLKSMLALLDDFPQHEMMNRETFPYIDSLIISVNRTTCVLTQYSNASLQFMDISKTNCSDILSETGFVVCQTDDVINDLGCQGSTFHCDEGTCILEHYYCDGVDDCLDGSDEINCRHVCAMHRDFQNISTAFDCFKHCHPSNCSCSDLYFQCETGGCIPASRLCDGTPDCPNDEDESFCVFCTEISPECKIAIFLFNDEVHVFAGRRGGGLNTKKLSQHFGGMQIHQKTTSSQKQNKSFPIWGTYRCIQGNQTIPVSQFNDLVPDCPGGDDEQLYKNFLLNQNAGLPVSQQNLTCTNVLMTTCEPGFLAVCFPRHKYCVLEVDELDQVRYCRNGAHLSHCRQYTCPAMFKCPSAFCIPFYMLCDSRIHCPSGEDEVACDQPLSCPGFIKCRSADVCLHWYDLKDGIARCPNSSEATDFNYMSCDTHCICLGNAAICDNLTLNSPFFNLSPYVRKLVIHNSDMTNAVTPVPFKKFKFLLFLNLAHNKMDILHPNLLAGLYFTKHINLSFCGIQAVTNNSFNSAPNLAILDLRENNITALSKVSVAGWKRLRHLYLQNNNLRAIFGCFDQMIPSIVSIDLSGNTLTTFPKNILCGNQVYLRYLNLSHNTFLQLDTIHVLGNLRSLQVLDLSPHHVCCLFQMLSAVCYPLQSLHFSMVQCADLVATPWYRSLLWTVAIFVLSLNSLVCSYLVYRIRTKPQVIYDLLRLLVHISDALLSVYIIGVTVADRRFRGLYVLYTTRWRLSIPCHFFSVLYSLSQYAPVTVMFIMAHMEMKLIDKPLHKNQKPLLPLLSLVVIPLIADAACRLLPVKFEHSSCCLNYTSHILSLQTLLSVALPYLAISVSVIGTCTCHALALSNLQKCPFEDKITQERYVKRFRRMAKRYIACDLIDFLPRLATLLLPAAVDGTGVVFLLSIVLAAIPPIVNPCLISLSVVLADKCGQR